MCRRRYIPPPYGDFDIDQWEEWCRSLLVDPPEDGDKTDES